MNVRELMSPEVNWIEPTASLVEAAQRMRDDDIGFLPVGENDRLVGMLTDRDIVLRVVAEQRDLTSSSVREAMSQDVLYVFDDQSVEEAAQSMAENAVRRMPVLNREKRMVGIVSLGDIAVQSRSQVAGNTLGRIAKA